MLKMIKYEYRKNLFPLLVVFFIFGLLQVYFTVATLMNNENHSVIAASLLMLAASCGFIFVLLYGIISYSADLKNKSGYLVFMAPISTYAIIGAKLITTLITGIILVIIIGGLAVIDYSIAADAYGLESLIELIKAVFASINIPFTSLLFNILSYILIFLVGFYTMITVAYLAVSLCSTVLQNNRLKGFIGFILFIALIEIITKIGDALPAIYKFNEIDTFSKLLINALPQTIFYFICTVISFLGSGYLLNKKISL